MTSHAKILTEVPHPAYQKGRHQEAETPRRPAAAAGGRMAHAVRFIPCQCNPRGRLAEAARQSGDPGARLWAIVHRLGPWSVAGK